MEWLPLLMFVAVCLVLLTGYPVALALGGTALLFAAGAGVVYGPGSAGRDAPGVFLHRDVTDAPHAGQIGPGFKRTVGVPVGDNGQGLAFADAVQGRQLLRRGGIDVDDAGCGLGRLLCPDWGLAGDKAEQQDK